MKIIIKHTFIIWAIVTIFTSCQKDDFDSDNSIVGKWQLISTVLDDMGNIRETDCLQETFYYLVGDDGSPEVYFFNGLVFKEDGSVYVIFETFRNYYRGKYTINKNELNIEGNLYISGLFFDSGVYQVTKLTSNDLNIEMEGYRGYSLCQWTFRKVK